MTVFISIVLTSMVETDVVPLVSESVLMSPAMPVGVVTAGVVVSGVVV